MEVKTKRRVGIFGGSFDPPTSAHEQLGGIFAQHFDLDEVRYVVTNQNPLKHKVIASTQQRWEMTLLMIQGYKEFSASDLEITSELIYEGFGEYMIDDEDTPSSTYNTMRTFQMLEPNNEFVLLGGSDILYHIYDWHKAKNLLSEFQLGIILREPNSVSSAMANIHEEHAKNVHIIETKYYPVSSTHIRNFFEEGNPEKAQTKMRDEVFEYVTERKIYIPQP